VTRGKRVAVVVGALVALQILAIVIYRAVERSRERTPSAARFAAERPAGPDVAPAVIGERVDGSRVEIEWPSSRIHIVHFWATWCEPCRAELPGLLALARDVRARGVNLVAIAVDDEWKDIRAFFAGDVPPEVVILDDASAHKRFGVSTLPDTYLVDRAGRLVERYFGARDWRAPAARDHLLTLVR
jgi:thiol-disulfide isomerase/thioredoxin